jgi:hypothetical protein
MGPRDDMNEFYPMCEWAFSPRIYFLTPRPVRSRGIFTTPGIGRVPCWPMAAYLETDRSVKNLTECARN